MAKVKMTYELAMAAGQDAGNKHMRKADRTFWNKNDYYVATKEARRLLRFLRFV